MAKLENISLINEMINEHYINVQRHPNADIWLYNYSSMCQIDHVWNEATTMCRGIIVDSDCNILARPFVKFFNYEEIDDKAEIPVHLPFEVYEKLDGSLGIMYWIDNTPYITTRGSFVSDQGIHATKILHEKYKDYFDKLDKSKTYLFEIIYPEDHHCISYAGVDDIFLLAVIDTDSGDEEDISKWSHIFKCTKKYDGINDFTKVREMFNGDNKEGFVIKFSNNYRIKMKYESYFKMAFIMNHLSEKVILDNIIQGTLYEIRSIIKQLNEENQIYYNQIIEKINKRFIEIREDIKSYYKEFDSDKEAAEYFLTLPKLYSGVLFNMRKGRDYSEAIWRQIRQEIKEANKNKEV